MDDSQALERSLRQQRTTGCDRGYRARSEKQNIATSPTTQKRGSHFNLLWRPFLEEACGLSRRHGSSRGCLVWFYRRGFVFKIHRQKPSDLCVLVDQPTIMLRRVSQPSARTRITCGTTNSTKTHISQKCQIRALS